MATASERIPVLVSHEQKQRLAARARAVGLSTGEYMRRAADAYQPAEDDTLLAGLLGQVEKTTAQAQQALTEALAFVAASEARIKKIEEESLACR